MCERSWPLAQDGGEGGVSFQGAHRYANLASSKVPEGEGVYLALNGGHCLVVCPVATAAVSSYSLGLWLWLASCLVLFGGGGEGILSSPSLMNYSSSSLMAWCTSRLLGSSGNMGMIFWGRVWLLGIPG